MRLIDADVLKANHGMKDDCADCDKELRGKSKSCEFDRNYALMDFCGWIDDAPTIEQCEDAVSRQDILDGAVTHYSVSGANIAYRNAVPVEHIELLPSVHPKQKKGRWIPVTRIEKWHKEEGLVGFPPEVKEFPQCTIEWVDATEPDEVDGLRCSKCGTVYDFTEARNWCSECGAKMEGQDED